MVLIWVAFMEPAPAPFNPQTDPNVVGSRKLSRKHFLGLLLGAGGAAMTVPALRPVQFIVGTASRTVYRIAPVPGVAYGASFLRFCERARFLSFDKALRSVTDPGLPFQILAETISAQLTSESFGYAGTEGTLCPR